MILSTQNIVCVLFGVVVTENNVLCYSKIVTSVQQKHTKKAYLLPLLCIYSMTATKYVFSKAVHFSYCKYNMLEKIV